MAYLKIIESTILENWLVPVDQQINLLYNQRIATRNRCQRDYRDKKFNS